MPVHTIATHQDFLATLQSDKLVVVDFTATWCGPCKMMAPVFDAFSQRFHEVQFCKVDVDAVKETASYAGVTAMPTFQFYKGGSKVGECRGANKAELEALIIVHFTFFPALT